jgi:hypothetical protein
MCEDNDELTHRYLFTVRQSFGRDPAADTFYELRVPSGITSDQAKMMAVLHPGCWREEIGSDTLALHGMQMRIRFNTDMFPKVCLVRSTVPISADDFDLIIKCKQADGTLINFLNEAALKI